MTTGRNNRQIIDLSFMSDMFVFKNSKFIGLSQMIVASAMQELSKKYFCSISKYF